MSRAATESNEEGEKYPYITKLTEAHKIIIDPESKRPTLDEEGNLLVYNSSDDSIGKVPNEPLVLRYFGIGPEEDEENSCQNMSSNTESQSPNINNSMSHSTVRPIPNNQFQKRAYRWSHMTVLQLIKKWTDRRARFENNIEKKECLWDEISREFVSEGHDFSANQCESKFKYLKKTYTHTKDINKKSTGQPDQTCPYYDEMEELFGRSPQINPPSLLSNRDPIAILSEPLLSSTAPVSTPPPAAASELPSPASFPAATTTAPVAEAVREPLTVASTASESPEPKKSRRERYFEKFLKEFREEARAREEARNQRHQELMAMQRESNQLFKDLMTRYLERM